MSIQIGTLIVEMSANVARLQEDMHRATKVVDHASHQIAKKWETVKTAFEAVIVGEFVKSVIESGVQAEQSANRLTAAYKLQANQVGITREQLDEMADSLAAATQFNDNDIKRGEAELLKFGNIYGEVFERAMKASADLAAFNGTNVASATEALGKALANPIDGTKALGAAIGKLSAEQREHIKTLVEQNKALEAQGYILDLVQKHIGGTAAQMNTGYTKAIEDTAKAWDKFKEALAGIVLIKDVVTGALDAIAAALRGVASVFQGGSFSEGMLGKQTAMAKQIMDLKDQIATSEGRKGLTFTDDQGRVMGEDLRLDDMKKKLQDLEVEYKKLYEVQAKAPAPAAKPDFGLTQDQLGFIKALRHQTDMVGQGSIAGLFAKADELHLGEKTRLMIQALGQAIQEEADQAKAASERVSAWKTAMGFKEGINDEVASLKLRTSLIGESSFEISKQTRLQQFDNQVRKDSIQMSDDQAQAFLRMAEVLRGQLADAMNENYKLSRRATAGFAEGLAQVWDASTDYATHARDFTVNTFKTMEDALVQFTKTGKLDFKSLADSIITDLIRIRIQQSVTAPLAAALSGNEGTLAKIFNAMTGGGTAASVGSSSATFSDANYIPARAGGGDISANQPYWVGEKGPELVVPRSNGTVIPNGGAVGGTTIHVSPVIHIDARSDQAQVMSLVQQGIVQSVAQVEQSFSRGGRMAKLVGTARG